MATKSPLQLVKDQYGGKDKLVDKLLGLVERGEESKDDLRTRLLAAPNSKLLRLLATTTEIKDRFGSKDKLVDAILGLKKRAKDNDYREKLLGHTPGRLLDLYRSSSKHTKKA